MSSAEPVTIPAAAVATPAPSRHLRPVRTEDEPGEAARAGAPRVRVAAHEPDYVSCRNLLPLRLRSDRRFSPLCFGLVPLGADGLAATCPVCGGPAML